MSSQKFKKDPGSTLDYSIDWARWMISGDFITSSSWTIETIGGDVSPLSETNNTHTNFRGTVWLTAGTRGNTYTCTNRIVTDQGRTDERSIFITVGNR